jgi:hypothetical protein
VSLIVNYEEHLLKALADTGTRSSSSSILEAYNSTPFIKMDHSDTPPGLQWVANLLKVKLKLGFPCDPEFRRKYILLGHFMWMTDLSHQTHML